MSGHEPWSDERLAEAFTVRSTTSKPPADLVGAAMAAVRARPARDARPGWRLLLPMAAAIVVAVTVVTSSLNPAVGPTPSASLPASAPVAPTVTPGASSGPAGPFGLPLLTVAEAIALRDGGADSREVVVEGWIGRRYMGRCAWPLDGTTERHVLLGPWCSWGDDLFGAESDVPAPADAAVAPLPSVAINVVLADVDIGWRDVEKGASQIVAIGHFDDRRATTCVERVRQQCRDAFVVDRIESADGRPVPDVSVAYRSPTDLPDPQPVQAAVRRADPQGMLLSAMAIGQERIAEIEPSLKGLRGGLADAPLVWRLQVLDDGLARTYLIRDGTTTVEALPLEDPPVSTTGGRIDFDAVIELASPDGPPIPIRLRDSTGLLVDARSASIEALSRRDEPTGRGAIDVTNNDVPDPDLAILIVTWESICDTDLQMVNTVSDPNGVDVAARGLAIDLRAIQTLCDGLPTRRGLELTYATAMRPSDTTATRTFEPVASAWPPDGAIMVSLRPTSWTTTEVAVVDRSGLLLAAAEPDELQRGSILRAIDANGIERFGRVRDVMEPGRMYLTWDGGGCDEPTITIDDAAATLSIDIGQRTCRMIGIRRTIQLDFADAAVVDRLATESLGSPMAPSTPALWPPEGARTVTLSDPVAAGHTAFEVAIVDQSGRLTKIAESSANEIPSGVGPDGLAALTIDPRSATRVHLVWTGSVCDDQATVTVDKEVKTITLDVGPLTPCDAMAVQRAVVLTFDAPLGGPPELLLSVTLDGTTEAPG